MVAQIRRSSFLGQNGRQIPKVPAQLCFADRLGAFKVRWALGRMKYAVEPGLYAVGEPDSDSHVFVTANYKLSFDMLRKELVGLDCWIMVLDTKAINVWCAAGKGTFGTDEMVRRIKVVELDKIVSHRRIIVPQLGAVGVAAHQVRKRTGFSVIYGPVRARDIRAFLKAGLKATEQMRQVSFSFCDRLVLAPVEFMMGGKYLLLAMAGLFIVSGLNPGGYSSDLAMKNGFRSVANVFGGFVAGSVIGPILLPWLPGRSFSFKGLSAGLIAAVALIWLRLTGGGLETVAWLFMIAAIASFATMNFTGASTYTSLSGVRKEMRVAVPLQVVAGSVGLVMWMISKFI
ncbi:MAG: mercury methylation corrinoid protein HgcA [Planctomycetota bacterium]|jgi:acetyl-CoA decarbonylase/synthase complex subunit gamma